MKTNLDSILFIIDLIEKDLSFNYSIEMLAKEVGYSKYHIHKMFTNVVGIPVHQYIKKRRLSEAAKRLLCTDDGVLDIALDVGYESQQAFTKAFTTVFKLSPRAFRHKVRKFSLTPKFEKTHSMEGDRIMDVRLENHGVIKLAGFSANTIKGFFAIPRLWKKLHKEKNKINNRISKEWVYAYNDYQNAEKTDDGLGFEYYACIEVDNTNDINNDISIKELPESQYAIFSFRAKPQDSIQSTIDYIYKEWFPSSTYQLNHEAKYDFVKYGEIVDEAGIADIEVWVPILNGPVG